MPKFPTDKVKMHAAAQKTRAEIRRIKRERAKDIADDAEVNAFMQRLAKDKPGMTIIMCRRGRK